jgi:hypothetical protein
LARIWIDCGRVAGFMGYKFRLKYCAMGDICPYIVESDFVFRMEFLAVYNLISIFDAFLELYFIRDSFCN